MDVPEAPQQDRDVTGPCRAHLAVVAVPDQPPLGEQPLDLLRDHVRLDPSPLGLPRPPAVRRLTPDLRQREVGAVARRLAGAARHRRQRREGQRRTGEDLAEELVDAPHQCVVAAERAAERQQRPASPGDELLQRGEAVHVRPRKR